LFSLIVLLSGCGLLARTVSEPPLPTIVQVTPTATPAAVQIPPTATSQQSANNTLEAKEDEAASAEEPQEANVSVETAATSTPVALPTDTPLPLPMPAEADPPAQLPPLDSLGLKLLPIASGLNKPVFLISASDDTERLFIVEQAGRILILKDGAVQPQPFLDIVSIVGSDANEQGLLSLAFHPDYANNGFFFVNYTDRQGDTVIARYGVSDESDIANPDSAKILLTIDQPYANHNGGQVVFGPDGYLYIGMGDGGAAGDPQNRAQNLETLLGKILRIDVDNGEPYGVPETNPFVGNEPARPEIWSYGWRNPWRFSFDRATNDMYIADVGQNQYEELHVEWANTPGGQNYGWRLMEGAHCFRPDTCDPVDLGLELPVAEYDHSLGCSITGGYVYRGLQFPALTGTYFYGDYCSGIIWGLRYEADGSWSQAELLRSSARISSFGQDKDGEVYLLDHQGQIFQLAN
jgi:glucose/arabinose dehydrogenase